MNINFHKILSFLKIFANYLLLILAICMISWFFYTKFIPLRLPKEIPLFLTEIKFYISLYICFIYLYIIKSLILPKEPNFYIKNLISYILYPLEFLDTTWKTCDRIQPYYLTIMSNLISYLESTSIIFKNFLFISFQILPRLILLFILIIDVFCFNKLYYIYKFIFLGLFPLFYRYVKYSLKIYKNHLIIFASKNYEAISITNIIKLLFAQESNPDAIHDGKKVSFEDYIEIVYENMIHIKNFDLVSYIEKYNLPLTTEYTDIESNIKYVGNGIKKNEFAIEYAKRFFNKTITNYIQDLTEIESMELAEEFNRHYTKIFILKDLIPLNDEIMNKTLYKYIRAFIYTSYFIIWLYLLVISYPYNDPFILTQLVIAWMTLYIDIIEPFSETLL